VSLTLLALLTTAVVEQPRPFGHVVGDIVTQRVLVDFEPASMPRTERVSVWFERRDARLETDVEGRRWLEVRYQIVNAPQSLTTVTVPAWQIDSRLSVPAWPLSVGPLTEREAGLRPDRAAPAIATGPLERRAYTWSGALVITLAMWLAWWLHRNRRASASLPFARALRELRSLEDAAPQSWQALHRAFDATAGRVVQAESLGTLFRRAPWLAALRSEIERFFAQSGERFFGGRVAGDPVSVRALCLGLRRLEKRYER
jgi:mxaA protein